MKPAGVCTVDTFPSSKVVTVCPAYNSARMLPVTIAAVPKAYRDSIILVDDHSQDRTVEVAEELGLRVIRHERNLGYGGNQKTCYDVALREGADIVVMLHPDFQYDPQDIPRLVAPLLMGEADAVFGSRFLGGDVRAGGMPVWKVVANRFLTGIENRVLGQRLSEYHCGFRAYSRQLLETVPYHRNANGFVFDTQIIIQAIHFGYRIWEIPIATRYFPEASSVGFRQGVRYGLDILVALWRYTVMRMGLASYPPCSSMPEVPRPVSSGS